MCKEVGCELHQRLSLPGILQRAPFPPGMLQRVPVPPRILQRAPLPPGLAGVMLRNLATISPVSYEQNGQSVENLSRKPRVQRLQTTWGEGRKERGAASSHLPSAAGR